MRWIIEIHCLLYSWDIQVVFLFENILILLFCRTLTKKFKINSTNCKSNYAPKCSYFNHSSGMLIRNWCCCISAVMSDQVFAAPLPRNSARRTPTTGHRAPPQTLCISSNICHVSIIAFSLRLSENKLMFHCCRA